MMKIKLERVVWVCLLSVGLSINAYAEVLDAKVKGLEIAQQVDLRDRGWGDTSAELTMELSNKHGNTSARTMTIKTLEVAGDGDKNLTVFNEPRDVKGTAFLSLSHTLTPDQQWLYLPALKRVKRIASVNKSGPFLGSEFSFEDLSSFEVEKFDYEYLRDDVHNGEAVFVVKYTPLYEYSGYKYEEVWIDKAEYRMQRIDYFDRKGSPLKTLLYNDYKQYLDQYWRASQLVVKNEQTGKMTTLDWNDYQFRAGLTDNDFNQSTLKRAR